MYENEFENDEYYAFFEEHGYCPWFDENGDIVQPNECVDDGLELPF